MNVVYTNLTLLLLNMMRLLKKRCPDIGAGGLPDVSGQLKKVPQDRGVWELIEIISAISCYTMD